VRTKTTTDTIKDHYIRLGVFRESYAIRCMCGWRAPSEDIVKAVDQHAEHIAEAVENPTSSDRDRYVAYLKDAGERWDFQ